MTLDWAQVLNGAGTTNKHDNRVHFPMALRY